MRHLFFILKFVLLILFLTTGCSSYQYWEGKHLMESQKYKRAIPKFLIAESKAPDNPKIHRDLGITYYQVAKYQEALKKLLTAKQLNSRDGLTIFYLGQTYEALGQLDKALGEYTQSSKIRSLSRAGLMIKKRIREILLKKISNDVKKAVTQENNLALADIPENSLAVLYFKNINHWKRLTPLEKGLAQMLTTDLSKVKSLRLVERLKLERLIQEIQLSQSDLFEPASVPRLGKLLGARRLIKGGFISNDEGQLQVLTAIVETRTGEMNRKEIQVKGGIFKFFELEKKLVFNIVKSLGIHLSYEEIKEIKKIPTSNFMAFLAYAEGLDFNDKGNIQEARKSFQRAVDLDPGFTEAKNELQLSDPQVVTGPQLSQLVSSIVARTPEARLISIGQNIGKGLQPAVIEDPALFRPSGVGTVIIRGNLPVSARQNGK